MRPSIKRSLTGLLIIGAVAFSAVGAEAMGGGNANGPDAGIGIIGGIGQGYGYSANDPNRGGGYQANTADRRHDGYGGYGQYNGGYYHGY